MIYQQSPLHQNILQAHNNARAMPAAFQSQSQPPEANLLQSVNYCADFSGCGLWRMKWPEFILNCTQSIAIHSSTCMILDERFYKSITSVRVQRQATPHQKKFIEFLKSLGKRVIYEVDDIIFREDIPLYNKFRGAFTSDQIRQTSQEIMNLCDEITVTCPFMRDYYRSKTNHSQITVIPNLPPRFWLDKWYDRDAIYRNYNKYCKRKNAKPRILYAGSGAHFDTENLNNYTDDFTHVVSEIEKTINEFQWVFIGGIPPILKPLVKIGAIEHHNWVNILNLPKFIHSLNINCMIAPLANNNFNSAKSDIKLVEAAAFGIPIVCQDMITYQNAPYKFNTGDDMISQIRYILKSSNRYMTISKDMRQHIKDRWLEDNIDTYKELYTYKYGDPRRVQLAKYNS